MPKTLPQKLFIKSEEILLVKNAPEGFIDALRIDLPATTIIATNETDSNFDIQIIFVETKSQLISCLPEAIEHLQHDQFLWLCYPKGGTKSAIPTDMNRDSIWQIAITNGLKAVHQIAIDDIWSGLRFRMAD